MLQHGGYRAPENHAQLDALQPNRFTAHFLYPRYGLISLYMYMYLHLPVCADVAKNNHVLQKTILHLNEFKNTS